MAAPPKDPNNIISSFLSGDKISNQPPLGSGAKRPSYVQSSPEDQFNVAVPLYVLYQEIKSRIDEDRSISKLKIVRFGPKVTLTGQSVDPDIDITRDVEVLRDAGNAIIDPYIYGDYENWVKKNQLQIAADKGLPVSRGEGAYQAGFSLSDLKTPSKALKREARKVVNAYVWDQVEKAWLAKQIDPGTGRPKYALRSELDHWNRVSTFLEDRSRQGILNETRKHSIPDSEVDKYIGIKKQVYSINRKIMAIDKAERAGVLPSAKVIERLNLRSELVAFRASAQGALVRKIDPLVGPVMLNNLQLTDDFIFEKGRLILGKDESRIHFISKWLAPTKSGDHLFASTGRLWQWQRFINHPFSYTFTNYIWKSRRLNFLGIKGLGLGQKLYSTLGISELVSKGFGKAASKFAAQSLKIIFSKISVLLKKFGFKALATALGSVVPGVGNIVGFLLASIAEFAVKNFKKIFVLITASIVGCFTLLFAIPIIVLSAIAYLGGANPTDGFGGIIKSLNGLIFQQVSAASNQPLSCFTSMSIAEIDSYLASNASPLMNGLGNIFYDSAQKYQVNPALILAIGQAETQLGISEPSLATNHNPWGYFDPSSKPVVFPTWNASIDAEFSLLAKTYVGPNSQYKCADIACIGSHYAPVGAANDPNNLNSNWVTNVNKFFYSIPQQGCSVSVNSDTPSGWPTTGWIQTQFNGLALHSDLGNVFDYVTNGTAIDIANPTGTPIYATMAGRVARDPVSAPGDQTVWIVNDSSGFGIRFRHMLPGSIMVKVGDTVTKGELVGLMDNSGHSTGPHLHYVIYSNFRSGPFGIGPGKDFYKYVPGGLLDSNGFVINGGHVTTTGPFN